MDTRWKRRRQGDSVALLIFLTSFLHTSWGALECPGSTIIESYVDRLFDMDRLVVVPGVRIQRTSSDSNKTVECVEGRSDEGVEDYIKKKFDNFRKTHEVSVNIPETARFFFKVDTGKSSFMAGFGMGFLAFALKKLLLPVFIGAQLIKSVLIAMFLPSILGSLGKIVGKGLSSFSGPSGSSGGQTQIQDFEFKDTSPYEDGQAYSATNDMANVDVEATNVEGINALESTNSIQTTNSRLGYGNQRVSYVSNHLSDNYYIRKPNKKTDYKVFHKIPSSSLLLTSYDPFYSPLLSRLDAVFQQLGLGDTKAPDTENCRERLVCLMYANPAKYAPYSNLVSAQLSRELNELRKPTSDNPDILRFFRYMKAARDGQDGEECSAHEGCPSLTSKQPSPAMLTTFNEINKLVQARKLN